MNRTDFQLLADLRNEEAGALLAQGKPAGAYYLAGYSVECALKACIAKQSKEFDFPDKALAIRCYTHSIKTLIECAGLKALRDSASAADLAFATNMRMVEDWSEESRYQQKTAAQADQLYDAINEPTHGVLPWLKSHW